jgi:hypothetical protein
MNVFRKIINGVNRTLGACAFGHGAARMFCGQYEIAAYCLFAVSILFIVGYYTERWV